MNCYNIYSREIGKKHVKQLENKVKRLEHKIQQLYEVKIKRSQVED